MDELREKTADLLDHAEDMAETYYKLAVVNVTEKASNVASVTVMMVLTGVLGLLILFFLGLALSWWLGDIIGSRIGGFLLGAAFFLLMLGLLWLICQRVLLPRIRNSIIRKVYEQQD